VARDGDAIEFAQHVDGIATGKAGHKDAAIPLPEGQAGLVVIMGRAAAHGPGSVPGAAQGADDVDELLRGATGDDGHWSLPGLASGMTRAMA